MRVAIIEKAGEEVFSNLVFEWSIHKTVGGTRKAIVTWHGTP